LISDVNRRAQFRAIAFTWHGFPKAVPQKCNGGESRTAIYLRFIAAMAFPQPGKTEDDAEGSGQKKEHCSPVELPGHRVESLIPLIAQKKRHDKERKTEAAKQAAGDLMGVVFH
jgi:hypothetical protein